jgi:hypothetical protein
MINFSTEVELPNIPSSLLNNQTALEAWVTDNVGEHLGVDVVDIVDSTMRNTDVPYTLYYITKNTNGIIHMWQEWGKGVQRDELVEFDTNDRVLRVGGNDLPEKSWWLVHSKVIHSFDRLNPKITAVRIKLNSFQYPLTLINN